MAAGEGEVLHVEGQTFNTDDLTYGEQREIKRICRLEIWNEEIDGPFENLNTVDIMPAVITVFMRRDNPEYGLEQALKLKPEDVFPEDEGAPPTKPAAKRSSARRSKAPQASEISGSQS